MEPMSFCSKSLSKSPSYLIRNPYSYCFRLKVPLDLRERIGKKELRYSLRTGSLSEAKYRARYLAGRIQWLFKSVRYRRRSISAMTDERELTGDDIQEIIRKYVWELLDSEEAYRATAGGGLEGQWAPYHDKFEDASEAVLNCSYEKLYRSVDIMIRDMGLDVDKDSDTYKRLARELAIAETYRTRVEGERYNGVYDSEVFESLQKRYPKQAVGSIPTWAAPAPAVEEKTSALLSAVIKEYWEENCNRWKARSLPEIQRGLDNLVLFLSDIQIHTVDHPAMRDYKQTLMQLPPNFSNAKAFKGKPFKDIIKIREAKGLPTLSVSTVNKYMGFAKGLFTYAFNNHHTDINPATGFEIKDKRRSDELRDPFSKEDLIKLFHSKQYLKDTHKHPYQFWLPILGLFTGCRLEELCQLYVEDVKQVNGVWVLDINEDKPDKSVKTSERRLVPLHPFIVNDLNFVTGFVASKEDPDGRIFTELKRVKEHYGHTPTQRFKKYKESCGIESPPRMKTFHSFRHTVANYLKQFDVDDKHIKELLGHSTGGVTPNYTGKLWAENMLKKTVLKLDYYDIDFSHLKASKYVINR